MSVLAGIMGAAAGPVIGTTARSILATYDTTANSVTFTQYHPTLGLEATQVLQLDSGRTVSSYQSGGVCYNGSRMVIAEIPATTSTSKTSRHYLINFEGGVGNLSVEDTFDYTATYYPTYPVVSPLGKSYAFYQSNVNYRLYNIESSFSSPTLIKSWTPSELSFGPRGGVYTPRGNIIAFHGTDKGSSIRQTGASTYSVYSQAWTGWNQSGRISNYDGTKHFYYGSAVNTNYFPFVRSFDAEGTSLTNLGVSNSWTLRPYAPNWNEGSDGLQYIVGLRVTQTANEWKYVNGYLVIDYNSNSIVRTETTTNVIATFMPDGKLLVNNLTSGTYTALDPTDSFADVSSSYNSTYLSNAYVSMFTGNSNRFYWWPNGSFPGLNSNF
jgi:hypothetical protein